MDNGGGWGNDMWDRPGPGGRGGGGPPRPLMDGPMDRPMDRYGGGPDSGWDQDDGPDDIHIVHMRGLPFRATQADIADVSTKILVIFQFDTAFHNRMIH